MDKATLKKINDWKGCKTDYWNGVKILEENRKLSDDYLKIVKHGLTPKSRIIVISKIAELKADCERRIMPKAKVTENEVKTPEIPKSPKKTKKK